MTRDELIHKISYIVRGEDLDKVFAVRNDILDNNDALVARVAELEAENGRLYQYASYLRSCALSGESDPHDFDTFSGKVTGIKMYGHMLTHEEIMDEFLKGDDA